MAEVSLPLLLGFQSTLETDTRSWPRNLTTISVHGSHCTYDTHVLHLVWDSLSVAVFPVQVPQLWLGCCCGTAVPATGFLSLWPVINLATPFAAFALWLPAQARAWAQQISFSTVTIHIVCTVSGVGFISTHVSCTWKYFGTFRLYLLHITQQIVLSVEANITNNSKKKKRNDKIGKFGLFEIILSAMLNINLSNT